MAEDRGDRQQENLWNELLSSPYDDQRRIRRKPDGEGEPRGRWTGVAVAVVLAIAVGAGVGWLLAPDGSPVAVTTTTTAAVTSTTAPTDESGFLVGYEPLDDTAFSAVAQFTSSGNTYVAVVETVAPGSNRTEVAPERVARYTMGASGLEVPADTEFTSVLTPGVRLVAFPEVLGEGGALTLVEGTSPLPIENTRDRAITLAGGETGPAFDGLPFTADDVTVIDVSGNTFISVDSVEVTDEWGIIEWHIEGNADAVARVDFFVEYVRLPVEGEAIAMLVPAHSTGPRFGLSQPPSPPGMSRGRTEQLVRVGPHATAKNPVTALTMWWRVEWSEATGTTAILPPAPLFE